MNEELHSTNDELRMINDQLQLRTTEINKAAAFLEAVLASLRHAVVVVDTELRIQTWNKKAEDLWGLRADEVRNHPLTSLDIGLPVQLLRDPLARLLDGKTDGDVHAFKATNRRGREITCRVSLAPLMSGGRIDGAIIIMEDNAPPRSR